MPATAALPWVDCMFMAESGLACTSIPVAGADVGVSLLRAWVGADFCTACVLDTGTLTDRGQTQGQFTPPERAWRG